MVDAKWYFKGSTDSFGTTGAPWVNAIIGWMPTQHYRDNFNFFQIDDVGTAIIDKFREDINRPEPYPLSYSQRWSEPLYFDDGVRYLTISRTWTQDGNTGTRVSEYSWTFTIDGGFDVTNETTGPSPDPDGGTVTYDDPVYSNPVSGEWSAIWSAFSGAALQDSDYLAGLINDADGESNDYRSERRTRYRPGFRMDADDWDVYVASGVEIILKWNEWEGGGPEEGLPGRGGNVRTYSEPMTDDESWYSQYGMQGDVDIDVLPWEMLSGYGGYTTNRVSSDTTTAIKILSLPDRIDGDALKSDRKVGILIYKKIQEVEIRLTVEIAFEPDFSTFEIREEEHVFTIQMDSSARITDVTSDFEAKLQSIKNDLGEDESIISNSFAIGEDSPSGFVGKRTRSNRHGFENSGNYYRSQSIENNWFSEDRHIEGDPVYRFSNLVKSNLQDLRPGTFTPFSKTPTVETEDSGDTLIVTENEYLLQAAEEKTKTVTDYVLSVEGKDFRLESRF